MWNYLSHFFFFKLWNDIDPLMTKAIFHLGHCNHASAIGFLCPSFNNQEYPKLFRLSIAISLPCLAALQKRPIALEWLRFTPKPL